jgi:transcriptional regulator with AAA-type ATPase domain
MAELRAAVRRLAERARAATAPPSVLILGETGTGKGLLASLLHRTGPRATGPLVAVNCASIPGQLLESELFGHERGAFTGATAARRGMFQAAHRGTLFLDEIGLLEPPLQAKLLTAVEQRAVRRLGGTHAEPVDVWILSATNEDLPQAVRQGRFREDLYHRLAVVTLTLPPLRARGRDVLLLAGHFLQRAATDFHLGPLELTPEAEAKILAHAWPGNVRELANVIDRAALLSGSSRITDAALDLGPAPATAGGSTPVAGGGRADPRPATLAGARADTLRSRVQAALDAHGGNITRAALALGIARNTLRAHIRQLNLRTGPGPGLAGTRQGGPPEERREPVLAPAPAETGLPVADPSTGTGDADTTDRQGPGPVPARIEPAPALRWERRLLAFLSVALTPASGQSALQLAPRLQELAELVRRFGGRLEELAPLQLLAVFGLDASEDAPRRAAAAALATTAALQRGARDALGRAAIDVAERLVGLGDPVTGMDPAERRATLQALEELLAAGGAGEILVAPAAVAHLDRTFDVSHRGGTTASGLAIHRLRARGARGAGRGRRLSPFVGRDHELAVLRSIVARVERGGGSQVVGIVGEPGVGKSRLLHELRLLLPRDRSAYLVGRCAPPGPPIPYLPIVELLRAAFGLRDGDEVEAARARLERGVQALGLDAATVGPWLLHLLGWSQGAALTAGTGAEVLRARIVETLRTVASAGSRTRPVVCAIEDLQWIDPSSLEVLTALLDGLRDSAVVVLTTYRPGFQLPWLGRSNVHQLALRRLDPAESLAILRAWLPESLLRTDLPARLVEQADGIPFYLEELARVAAEQGHPDATIRVPDTIHGALAARLERLGLPRRRLLHAAAVIGREFSRPVLAAAVARDEGALETDLEALKAAEFIVPTGLGPGETYRFKHALTHEVAYRALLEPERRALHARVAEAIQEHAPDVVQRRPEVLARHHTEGGRPHEAIRDWRRAGRLALERSAHTEAIAHLTAGLQLLPGLAEGAERDRAELMLLLDLGTALIARLGYAAPEVAAPLDRARVLADRFGGSVELFPVRWALWRFALARADYAHARRLASQLLASAAGDAGPDLDLAARVAAGVTAFYLGEFEAARVHLDRARRLHDPARAAAQIVAFGQELGSVAVAFLGWTEAIVGQLQRAAATARDAVALARALGHPFSLGLVLYLVAVVHQLRGDGAMLTRLGPELLALADEHGYRLYRAFGLMVSGWAERVSGSPGRAAALIREGAELFQAVGQRAGLSHRVIFAAALIEAGVAAEALEVLHEAQRQAEATGEGAFLAEIHRLHGEALLREGRLGEAAAALQRGLAHASSQGAWLFALRAAVGLVRLAGTARLPPAEAGTRLCQVLAHLEPDPAVEELRAARALVHAPAGGMS